MNGRFSNPFTEIVVTVTLVLGVSSVLRAAVTAFGFPVPGERWLLVVSGALGGMIPVPIVLAIRRRRRADPDGSVSRALEPAA